MADNTIQKRVGAAAVATLLVAAFALLSGGDITSIRTTLGAGTSSYSDPTTTIGDLVTRGDAGVTRIAIGADGGVLTSVAGRAVWAAAGGSSPTTTRGDLIRRGASADERVALGTTGYVLTAGATDPAWAAPSVTAAQISDGTSTGRSVLTAATPAAGRSALVTTMYASDCVAANGAGADATASISGSGAGSTVAFAVSNTTRQCRGSGINAGSLTCTLPAHARRVTLYVRPTAMSGVAGGGYRYLQMSVRSAASLTSALFGVADLDNTNTSSGDMRSGSNVTQNALTSADNVLNGSAALNVWGRVRWDLEIPAVWWSTAPASTTRPVRWTPSSIITLSQAGATASPMGSIPVGSDAQVVICFESYGNGSNSTLTIEPQIEVE